MFQLSVNIKFEKAAVKRFFTQKVARVIVSQWLQLEWPTVSLSVLIKQR